MSSRTVRSIVSLPALALALASCGKDECDPTQQLVDNVCIAAAVDAGAEQDSSAAERDGGAFGAPCAVDADCAAPLDTCALPPEEEPFCTRKGCDAMPAICPSDWECVDLSTFVPGLHLCGPKS